MCIERTTDALLLIPSRTRAAYKPPSTTGRQKPPTCQLSEMTTSRSIKQDVPFGNNTERATAAPLVLSSAPEPSAYTTLKRMVRNSD